MPSRDRSMRFVTWNSSGMHGNVFVHARSIFDPEHRGVLHSLSQNPTSGIPVQVSSGQPETGSGEKFWTVRPILKRRQSTMSSFPTDGIPRHSMTEQRLQTSEPQFEKFQNPSTFLCWQKKVQDPGWPTFRFSLQGNLMDERRRDVRFSGGLDIIHRSRSKVRTFRTLRCLTRGLLLL